MTIPTVQEFEDGKTDLDDLESIVNGLTTVTTRLGNSIPCLNQALSQITISAITAYSAATTYTLITQWVEESGIVYRPLPSALPIGPEAFNSSNWVIAQGVSDRLTTFDTSEFVGDIDILADTVAGETLTRLTVGATNGPSGAPLAGAIVKTITWDIDRSHQWFHGGTTTALYYRVKVGGVWSAWVAK